MHIVLCVTCFVQFSDVQRCFWSTGTQKNWQSSSKRLRKLSSKYKKVYVIVLKNPTSRFYGELCVCLVHITNPSSLSSSSKFPCSCFIPFHTSQCIWSHSKLLQTKWQNSQTFSFLFEVVRGFLARRRCKRLREEAAMNAKKSATFLQYSSVHGNKLFLKQEELLQLDNKKKEGKTVTKKFVFI